MDDAAADVITDSFYCPITFEIMVEPVICADGHSYEKSAIQEWFKLGNKESPRTNATLESLTLISNKGLKTMIQAWLKYAPTRAAAAQNKVAPESPSNDQLDELQDGVSAADGASAAAKKKSKKKKKKKGGTETEAAGSAEDEEFRKTMFCPLTTAIMEDPVVCSDGCTYEKKAIEEQLASGNTKSVQSGDILKPAKFIPNIQLRQTVQAWLEVTTKDEDKKGGGNQKEGSAQQSSLEVLMTDACRRELKPAQKDELLTKLENPQDVLRSGLTPASLRSLVEHNPLIAIECLVKLSSLRQLPQFLTALVASSMSLQSIEVVFRLMHNIDVPQKFVRAYVLKCIRACSEMSTKDNSQSRAVRLLCVFLQGIIRSRKFDASTCLVELQAFCIEFSSVKEAGSCHRMLRALDQADPSKWGASSTTPCPSNRTS